MSLWRRALEGAVLTSRALSRINPDVAVFALPELASDWADVETVRAAIGTSIESGFEKRGFVLGFWSDVDRVRLFSRGFEVRRPGDLQGRRVALASKVDKAIFQRIKGLIGADDGRFSMQGSAVPNQMSNRHGAMALVVRERREHACRERFVYHWVTPLCRPREAPVIGAQARL